MSGLLENGEDSGDVDSTSEDNVDVGSTGEDNVDVGSTSEDHVDVDENKSETIAEKPDYLEDKFWDSNKGIVNVESLNKSYNELRKVFNEKHNDQPGESYEDYAAGLFNEDGKFGDYNTDDPVLKIAIDAAKDAGIGIKQNKEFLSKFTENLKEIDTASKVNLEEEKSKLGANADKTITGIKTWVSGMLRDGEITEEVFDQILQLGSTAAGITALSALRTKSGEMGIPTGEAITGTTHMSAQDWYSATYETHAESGESNAAFEERMHNIGKKIFGEGSGNIHASQLGRYR